MLDICLLGTGSMMPLPYLYLTAMLARCGGSNLLIDCGEGTQVAIRAAGLGFKRIGTICLTHFHADHVAGLPGLLLTIGNSGRTEPITIIGPQYIENLVKCLCVIAPQLPYSLHFLEISTGFSHQIESLAIEALPVEHMVPCYAYRFRLSRAPRFLREKAEALGLPPRLWSRIQAGETVIHGEEKIRPEQVLGPPRQGLSLCYATDMRPSEALVDFARSADLFVCEGNYGDPAKREKAVLRGHCTFEEAAEMARRAEVKELWLTHYSASMPDPETYLPLAQAIFPHSKINAGRTTLAFPRE